MEPLRAQTILTFQNPLVDWEEYQVTANGDGTYQWILVIYDPETNQPLHSELVPPVDDNIYL